MKEDNHESQEKDSLISKPFYDKFDISAKDKLEQIEIQKNKDFFDVFELVGSYKYKEVVCDL